MEARKILMEDAMKRGDQKALMEIPMEDEDMFHERWMRHVEEVSRPRQPIHSRTGPPDDVRKKLREKRKKKI